MKLVIFDLDQTLVDFIKLHDEATKELFKRFFGIEARLTEIDFAGRSLNENFAVLARAKNVPESTLRRYSPRELIANYERIFSELMRGYAFQYILPGVRELLEELKKTDSLIVLYTGDSPGIVERVLAATGLGKYFKFALYGTETHRRADMVRLAIERAEKITGKKFKDKNVVVIGDSIRDIDSGKQFNALTIAVATGFHSKDELARHQPDYLFENLKDFKKVIEAILQNQKEVTYGHIFSG